MQMEPENNNEYTLDNSDVTVPNNFSISQLFTLRTFKDTVLSMNREQLQRLAYEQQIAIVQQSNYYKELIGQQWGILTPKE